MYKLNQIAKIKDSLDPKKTKLLNILSLPEQERIIKENQDKIDKLEKFRYERILVIDDEEFCITSMTTILRKIGIDVENQVDYCITGIEAIEKLKETYLGDMKYKFIFTDFNMPEMDGIQATYKMREFLDIDMQLPRQNQPAIIGLTGHVEDKFKLDGLAAGMDDVRGKPVYLREVEQLLKNNIYME